MQCHAKGNISLFEVASPTLQLRPLTSKPRSHQTRRKFFTCQTVHFPRRLSTLSRNSFDASVETIELYVQSVLPFYLTRAWTGDPFSVNAAEGCCNRLLVAFLKTDSKSKYTKRKFKCRSLRIIILKNGSRFPWCRKHLDGGVLQRLCYHHTSTVGWTRRVASEQTPCSYFLLQWRRGNTGLCLSCLLPEPLIAIWLASALISSSSSSTHARTCTHGGAAASLTDSIIKKNKKVIVHFIFLTKSFNRWGGKK